VTRVAALLAAAVLLSACSNSQSAGPPTSLAHVPGPVAWSMFRGDLSRDGHPAGATLSAATAAHLVLAWQADLNSPIESGPLVAGGLVVVGTAGGSLAALTPTRGEKLWEVTGLGPLRGQPLIAEGKVFAGSGDGHLYAVELLTGNRIWDWRAPGLNPAILGGPVLYKGLLLVGIGTQLGAPLEAGRLAALDPASGDRLWATCLRPGCEAGGGVVSSIAIDSTGIGYVEVGSPLDALAAFDVGIGKVLWTHPLATSPATGMGVTATPLIFLSKGRERVAAAGPEGRFTVVAAATGSDVWSRLLFNGGPADSISGSPGSDGRLLFVPSAGTPSGVQAVGRDDGQAVWSYQSQQPVFSSPAVGKDVVVFGEGPSGGDPAGSLLAVSTRDGHEVWRFAAGVGVVASPAIVGDSVFGADAKGRVFAFRPGS
jgi:eukaryotic-like serine/threonine-protein kinase